MNWTQSNISRDSKNLNMETSESLRIKIPRCVLLQQLKILLLQRQKKIVL